MSIEIVNDGQRSVLVNSTTDMAFGPVFWGDEDAAKFLEWLPGRASTYQDHHLASLAAGWRNGMSYAEANSKGGLFSCPAKQG